MGKKKQIVLCDTNILFQLLKGNEKIKKDLEKIGSKNIAFSIITCAEAFAGSSKYEVKFLKPFFNELILSNTNRHSKWIPDALIAATAISYQIELFTSNRKDFDFIQALKLYNP